jgi:hypothetical protein
MRNINVPTEKREKTLAQIREIMIKQTPSPCTIESHQHESESEQREWFGSLTARARRRKNEETGQDSGDEL